MNCEDSGLAPVVVVAEGVVEQDALVVAAEYVLGFVVCVVVGIVDLLVEFAVVGVVAHYVVGVVTWVVDRIVVRVVVWIVDLVVERIDVGVVLLFAVKVV